MTSCGVLGMTTIPASAEVERPAVETFEPIRGAGCGWDGEKLAISMEGGTIEVGRQTVAHFEMASAGTLCLVYLFQLSNLFNT